MRLECGFGGYEMGCVPIFPVAVAHRDYREMSLSGLAGLMKKSPVVIDVKSIFNTKALNGAGMRVWRL